MRILVCGINYAPDLIGVSKYNAELCAGFAANGHDVRVVTGPPYYPQWAIPAPYRGWRYRREVLDGVAVTRVPIYVPARPSGLRRALHHMSFALSSAWPIVATAMAWRPDVVLAVAPSLLSAPVAALAARVSGAASWLHVQDFEIDAAFELGLLRGDRARGALLALERRILGMFDRVSTISPQMLRGLEAKGVAPGRLRDVRNWCDTVAIAPRPRETIFRAALGLAPSDIIGLYSGAMSNKQGLDLLIDAAALIRGSGRPIHFVLCGSGPARAELQRQAAGLDNVHFLDLQPPELLSELLATADIHILPQKAEAADLVLPSKLSGMLASGRASIVMTRPDTGIAQEADGAALVVPPGDAAALADALVTLAGDEPLRTRLGAAARRRAETHWDRTTIIRSIENEFLALRGKRLQTPESVARARPA